MKAIAAGGVDIPVLGLGTWQLSGRPGADMVREALAIGYRHIDTAARYGNEADIGDALRASGLPRGDLFVTTKVWPSDIGPGALQRSAEDSLQRLGLDHVDLLLIHWPNPDIPLADSLGALADAKRRGMARAVGVCNFPSALFDEAARLSPEPLATNQIEYHPYLSQRRVLEAVRRHGSTLTAYSPLAVGAVARDAVLIDIAAAHGVTAGQAALRWFIQQEGVIAIPKTGNPQRARQNFDIWTFTLSDSEMAAIFALARPGGRLGNPGWSPDWDAD